MGDWSGKRKQGLPVCISNVSSNESLLPFYLYCGYFRSIMVILYRYAVVKQNTSSRKVSTLLTGMPFARTIPPSGSCYCLQGCFVHKSRINCYLEHRN